LKLKGDRGGGDLVGGGKKTNGGEKKGGKIDHGKNKSRPERKRSLSDGGKTRAWGPCGPRKKKKRESWVNRLWKKREGNNNADWDELSK